MARHARDHSRLGELQSALAAAQAEREELETAWLEASELLEAQTPVSGQRSDG